TMHASRPSVSSPLANNNSPQPHTSSGPAAARIIPQRTYSFPRSSALRPFPTISTAATPAAKKPVKMIQPPANLPSFTLNLTQAELSRRQ
ncbi:hypothetical protein C8R45DRAFT_807249, partial [Mycena sanguinolenta]